MKASLLSRSPDPYSSTYPSKENLISFSKDVSRAYRSLSMMVRSNGFGARGLPSLSYGQARLMTGC